VPASPREEYLRRIQRVQDYIERHLDRDLRLEELADVARFSPYHFHRVFRGVTGEPIHQFILRLRLEKAAGQLLHQPEKPVTAVALDCGFGSPAAFARSFRARFGESASTWRQRKSKKHQALSKAGEAPEEGASYLATVSEADSRRKPMTTIAQPAAESVRVEDLAPFTVAYVRHVGPYAGNSKLFQDLFSRLGSWAGPRGLMNRPGARVIVVYHDDPSVTEEAKLRVSACMEVPDGTKPSGDVGVMQIPGGPCAIARFNLGTEDFGGAWGWVYGTWLASSGYQPDDRPGYEQYLSEPNESGRFQVELVVPVVPLRG
jgi:AraC family transcriptional regulator